MRIVIIGNGVAGATCALEARARDADARIVLVGRETDYFFSRTALMYAFMNRMTRRELEPMERDVWDRQRIERVRDEAVDVNADARTVTLRGGRTLSWDRLVLALGAEPRQLTWPGMDAVRDGVVHFVSMQDLDACERLAADARSAVVVGGGLIGIELVECLMHVGVATTFLVREPWYWPVALAPEESEIVSAHLREHGVDLRFEEEVVRVHADPDGRVASVETTAGDRVACRMLGVCAGVVPAVREARAFTTPPELGQGIRVDARFRTSLPDVFAIGDCAERYDHPDGPAVRETIWYSARRHGAWLGRHGLFGDDVPHRQPTFFNSSRFFEIDFTTAGDVSQIEDGTPSILLRQPRTNRSVRIVHDEERVLAFNLLGSRWDHEVLVRWIEEKRSPAWVLDHLRDAQYDVEFGRAPLARFERRDVPFRRRGRP